ncbi:hemolysin XhlA family protein [Anaerocolumna xylanovorans]|uniref:Haemolysin XhlA n=1 Tax=Anaerocolumna xylanovorans DSM 12503 TaxID=1121345 RepID=A0A1M7YBN8_9FIRM|nr:hemolysin XhlA family protein [Anaerocolumna xylanovorans]SHO50052.1 Haemolysin XhlA [Anaerocolumna xylanovorans DSM 12503]
MPEVPFEREVLDRLKTIEVKLDGYRQMKARTYENEREIIEIKGDLDEYQKRISGLEDSNKWLTRAIAAALISALVGLLFAFVKMGAGM